jgi:osmotically-inducible protein OsmY
MRLSLVASLLMLAGIQLLQGCAAVAVGGIAGTVVMSQDRRTVGTITEDAGIELKSATRLGQKLKEGVHINATSYNRMLLLTGEVPDTAAREEAERIARSVENVRGVYNELAVSGVSSYTVRSNDTLITSKVKTRFLDAKKFNGIHMKVVTENSVVYLMGLVQKEEANDATEIARTTSGVQKVVRVFEYIDTEPVTK